MYLYAIFISPFSVYGSASTATSQRTFNPPAALIHSIMQQNKLFQQIFINFSNFSLFKLK